MCFTLKALLFGGKLGPSSGGISGNSLQYVPFGLDVPSELFSRYAESSCFTNWVISVPLSVKGKY